MKCDELWRDDENGGVYILGLQGMWLGVWIHDASAS